MNARCSDRIGRFIAIAGALACAAPLPAASVLYVDDDAPAGGDGQTWETAFRFLQDALDAAEPGSGVEEIRVGQGQYMPDRDETCPEGTGDREATFQLLNGVALMGGYAGYGARDPDARDVEAYETILSGDLNGDDGSEFENYEENSYHVVTGSGTDETAVIDGFVIRGGNADGSLFDQYHGGGMFNDSAAPTVTDCKFVLNIGAVGDGMCNLESEPVITSCHFRANGCSPMGSAVYNWYSNPVVTDCVFSENDDVGLWNHYSPASVTGCVFTDNGGRALENVYESMSVIVDCIFTGNGESGMLNGMGAASTIIGCSFVGNTSDYGAGMFNNETSGVFVLDCVFAGNVATKKGGGVYNSLAWVDFANCAFVQNSSAIDAGGMYNSSGFVTVTNCAVVCNGAQQGGGIFSYTSGTVMNCILAGNEPDQIYDEVGGLIVSYSDVEGGWFGPGEHNIDADPKFVDPDSGDCHLAPFSPCIDAGDNTAVPEDVTTDLDGNPRFVDDMFSSDEGYGDPPLVDMGCYEYQADQCPADVNEDGIVDVLDLLSVLGAWGQTGDLPEDIYPDGVVDTIDLLVVLGTWGPC